MKVVPAPLETNIETLVANVCRLSPFYTRFQIDIADGLFVPNTTIQIREFMSIVPQLPRGLIYDFHLMVEDPQKHIDDIQSIPNSRIDTILIHTSVFPNHQQLTTTHPDLNFGLVLNPEDAVASIDKTLLITLHSIQIMTVTPGFQGQPFLPDMLKKIEQLKKAGFLGEILIDGSVNDKTIPVFTKLTSPPDILGIGSYLTKASDDDLPARVEFLRSQLVPGNKPNEK